MIAFWVQLKWTNVVCPQFRTTGKLGAIMLVMGGSVIEPQSLPSHKKVIELMVIGAGYEFERPMPFSVVIGTVSTKAVPTLK